MTRRSPRIRPLLVLALLFIGFTPPAAVQAQSGQGLRRDSPAPAGGDQAAGAEPTYYIPGMPAPKAKGEAADKDGGKKEGKKDGGRISRITKVDRNRQTAREAAAPPAEKDIYQGVIPGDRDWLRRDERRRDRSKSARNNQISWIGFRPDKGAGSQIFIQTLHPTSYTVDTLEEGTLLRLTIEDARIVRRNDRRPIDTRYWSTAVESFHAKQVKRQAEILVTLKRPVAYSVRKDGSFIYIDFKDGDAPKANASTP